VKLGLKSKVDFRRVVWSLPGSTITPFCSHCQQFIPPDYKPLVACTEVGARAHFCENCLSVDTEVVK
jgi:hypothetical protein